MKDSDHPQDKKIDLMKTFDNTAPYQYMSLKQKDHYNTYQGSNHALDKNNQRSRWDFINFFQFWSGLKKM